MHPCGKNKDAPIKSMPSFSSKAWKQILYVADASAVGDTSGIDGVTVFPTG
jgi:hypothetical protein